VGTVSKDRWGPMGGGGSVSVIRFVEEEISKLPYWRAC